MDGYDDQSDYEDDVDRLEQRAQEQSEILENAGLSDASDKEQQDYLDDYYEKQREAEGYEEYRQQCEDDHNK